MFVLSESHFTIRQAAKSICLCRLSFLSSEGLKQDREGTHCGYICIHAVTSTAVDPHYSIILNFPPHRWCTACRGWSSHSSPTPGHSHSGLQDQIQGSNPNSSPLASLGSGAGPPPTGPQSQPRSPPQPPFPREGTQTHLEDRKCFTHKTIISNLSISLESNQTE